MWKNRRVIVAGGTAGFGLVLTRHLLTAGARVLVVGRSSAGVRAALAACENTERVGDAEAEQSRVQGVAADLAVSGEGGRVIGECLRLLGGVDDLFFCIGQSGRGRILDTSVSQLDAFLQANLRSAVEITQAAADDVARSKGHLVFIGSIAGKLVTPYMGPYCVAKAALAAFVDAVRLEFSPRGGHVLLVSPGPIRRDPADPRAENVSEVRYASDAARGGLPHAAIAPGGGTKLRPLDPDWLAHKVLAACQTRQSELVVPSSARLLAGLIEWFPDLGRRLLAWSLAGRSSIRQSLH